MGLPGGLELIILGVGGFFVVGVILTIVVLATRKQ